MEYVIIIGVLLFLGYIIFKNFEPKIKTKKLIESLTFYLNKLNTKYDLTILKKDTYDIDLKINDKHYVIKILIVPEYSEIQINSRVTWEVKYGAGNTPGKAQPHRRYLTEISEFQKKDFDENIIKLVLINPKPKKIVKYINECEIIFVKSSTDVYGSKIITKDNFDIFKK